MENETYFKATGFHYEHLAENLITGFHYLNSGVRIFFLANRVQNNMNRESTAYMILYHSKISHYKS